MLLLVLPIALPATQEANGQGKEQSSPAEIKKLIAELGDAESKARENAATRLVAIGLAALDGVQEAADAGADVELKNRAGGVVQQIRAANRLPTRVNGAEFKLELSEKDWKIAKGSEKAPAGSVALVITNRSPVPRRFAMHGSKLIFRNGKGETLDAMVLGQKSGGKGTTYTDKVSQNESCRFEFATVTISLKADQLSVAFKQWTSFSYKYANLSTGSYSISIKCKNAAATMLDDTPLWVGEIETFPEEFTLSREK